MTHLDLFSGIGGFAYAVDQVWNDVEHIFCDFDPFCRQVINKHWKDSYIYDDIRAITAESDIKRYIHGGIEKQPAVRQQQAQREPEPGVHPSGVHADVTDAHDRGQAKQEQQAARYKQRGGIDLLTRGFPCQPFSAAGLRRGTADSRHLWPEMLRVIRLTQPTWVIAENVRGLITWDEGVVFEQVCTDLEASGYDVQAFIIPAAAIGAPHRRDRIWFVANARHGNGSWTANRGDARGPLSNPKDAAESKRPDSLAREGNDTNSDGSGLQEAGSEQQSAGHRGDSSTSSNSQSLHAQGQYGGSQQGESWRESWSKNWVEVAAKLCSVDDGLSAGVGDFTLTKAGHRKEQLKAYGNAIVPQVAIEIMKGMLK